MCAEYVTTYSQVLKQMLAPIIFESEKYHLEFNLYPNVMHLSVVQSSVIDSKNNDKARMKLLCLIYDYYCQLFRYSIHPIYDFNT